MCLSIIPSTPLPPMPAIKPLPPVPQVDPSTPTLPPVQPELGQIEPLPPSAEAIEAAMQEGRALQQTADFDPTVALPNGTAQLAATAQQAGNGLLGQIQAEVEPLTQQLDQASQLLTDLEENIQMYSQSKVESALNEILSLGDQGQQQLAALQDQLDQMRQSLSRLGEDKANQILGPIQDKLNALQNTLQGFESRLQAALPPGMSLDLQAMKASVRLQHAVGELSAEVSRSGAQGQASVSGDTFRAYIQASTQTGASGGLEINSGAFRALIEASSQTGVEGQLEVRTEALQLLIAAADGQVSSELQVQVDALKLQLQAGSQGASGRLSVDTEAFSMILDASASGGSARIEVDAPGLNALLEASSDGSASGRVEVSSDSLRLIAEVAYKENLSAKLGIETDSLQVEIGSDGRNVNWRVAGQDDDFGLGLSGANTQMSGVMRVGEVGIEIGWHDASVDVPEAYRQKMESMGGEPVTTDMYGVMVSFPF